MDGVTSPKEKPGQNVFKGSGHLPLCVCTATYAIIPQK
ncbi:hypothetical protein MTY_1507 [Moorella thermoacetica Y72]|uniref:Uncharacterized protein n=1 Tax=Moorella thermoacetica Y72 TaxID=1325331 RepID=A0A0S6UDZ8_NEOTH|nr:hypothetical protein MTY_1507 [Moorella thermoacetica Y72]